MWLEMKIERNKAAVGYLGVRIKVANWLLRFSGLKLRTLYAGWL